MMRSKILRMLILGAPGSGKGTIAKRIVRDFGLLHLSSGDILRAQIAAGTKAGIKAKEFIDEGNLVPDSSMVDLILDELQKVERNWLLDGMNFDFIIAGNLATQFFNVFFDVIVPPSRRTMLANGELKENRYFTEINIVNGGGSSCQGNGEIL